VSSPASLLRGRGLAPKKRFGQNFLLDARACERIAEAATPAPGGTVLEIGPGLGALTEPLLARAGQVVAVEYDADLVPLLRERLGDRGEALRIVEGDALDQDWLALLAGGPRPRVVAGNLPYLVTGRLLERAVTIAADVDRAVFMVQAEVADRLLARPGTKAYGALTVFTRAAFDVQRLLTLRGGAFYPAPEVASSVVVLEPLRPARARETPAFRAAVRAAFGARRKTLRNAWRGLFGWSPAELAARAADAAIDLDARGETLDVEAFGRIAALAPSGAR
jgi:16S rRNA (adenine1518-N6/adenine1519-N6)-dimethyltransferase